MGTRTPVSGTGAQQILFHVPNDKPLEFHYSQIEDYWSFIIYTLINNLFIVGFLPSY